VSRPTGSIEDIDRGVVVPIQRHTALARNPTIREFQVLEDDATTGASLGRVGGVNRGVTEFLCKFVT
jgi:hypothetical protein